MLEHEDGYNRRRRFIAIVLIVALTLPVPAIIYALYFN